MENETEIAALEAEAAALLQSIEQGSTKAIKDAVANLTAFENELDTFEKEADMAEQELVTFGTEQEKELGAMATEMKQEEKDETGADAAEEA